MVDGLGCDALARMFELRGSGLRERGDLVAHASLRLVCRRWRDAFDALAREPWASLWVSLHAPRDVERLLRAPFARHVTELSVRTRLTQQHVAAVTAHCRSVARLDLYQRSTFSPYDDCTLFLVESWHTTLRQLKVHVGLSFKPSLFHAVASCNKLEKLWLICGSAQELPAGAMAEMFGALAVALRYLVLFWAHHTDVVATALAAAAPAPRLQHLGLLLPSLDVLASLLRADCARDVEFLELDCRNAPPATDAAVEKVLTAALPSLRRLETLWLPIQGSQLKATLCRGAFVLDEHTLVYRRTKQVRKATF
eukprot:TRINITY_DN5462_c0_g1_i2.p1 TRINITY_DN5462_c0_g1~~TRINITY_DN5462_c0_g1_i2.p1  ORF type:complete len:319 (-),score=89.23 TRINITY_DN5462_c0_g1_i2:66-995(-)